MNRKFILQHIFKDGNSTVEIWESKLYWLYNSGYNRWIEIFNMVARKYDTSIKILNKSV